MKRSIWHAAAGGVLTAALATTAIPSASATPANTAAAAPAATQAHTPDRATVAAFGRLAQSVLAQRTAALLDRPQAQRAMTQSTAVPTAHVGLASAEARSQSKVLSSLKSRRSRLRTEGEAYSSGKTAVTVNSVHMSGDKADVLITETTTLTYEKLRGDEPPATGFQTQHEATFVATPQGHWQLTGITDLDTSGFPQVNEVMAAHPQVTLQSRDSFLLKPATQASGPVEAPTASTDWPTAPNPKPATNGALNYTAMANYATTYWNHYNPAYRQFNGAGGDCTNFISQSLKAGGWAFASGWASDYNNTWWYSASNPATQSWSWNGVNEWSWYAMSSGRVKSLPDVYQLGVGDILQMDFDGDGSKDHSMIVTYRSRGGMPYVTYHSNNVLNRSVASLVAAFPDALYYAYRT